MNSRSSVFDWWKSQITFVFNSKTDDRFGRHCFNPSSPPIRLEARLLHRYRIWTSSKTFVKHKKNIPNSSTCFGTVTNSFVANRIQRTDTVWEPRRLVNAWLPCDDEDRQTCAEITGNRSHKSGFLVDVMNHNAYILEKNKWKLNRSGEKTRRRQF